METNPYQPPTAKLIDEAAPATAEPAGRGQRLAAAVIDGVIGLALIGAPLMFLLGSYDLMRRGIRPPWSLTCTASAIGFAVFLLLHGYFLKTAGQTIGKKLIGIRIVDLDARVPRFGRLVLLRLLPLRIAGLVPVVGPFYGLVDVLFIFRRDQRCLHDLIAGTRVIKCADRSGAGS